MFLRNPEYRKGLYSFQLFFFFMIQQIQTLQTQVLAHLPNITDESTLIDYRNAILGKSGELTTILK